MRRIALVVLALALALPAYADDEDDAPAPRPSPGAKVQELPSEAPQSAKCTPPAGMKADLQPAFAAACSFFGALGVRDERQLVETVRAPFFFEGKSVNTIDEVRKRWAMLLGELRGTSAPLYGIELLSSDDMVKKYGKPPAKLEAWPLKGALFAVGNLGGKAKVAALRKENDVWMVFAFHD